MAAPTKKRERRLTEGATLRQIEKSEPQNSFLSSLLIADGRELKSNSVETPKEEPVDDSNLPQPSSTRKAILNRLDSPFKSKMQLETRLGDDVAPASVLDNDRSLQVGRKRPLPHKSEDAARELVGLRLRVGRLERSERRLQRQLHIKGELVKDTKVTAEEAQAALIAAEEEIENLKESSRVLRAQVDRYQGWWLTEYHSLKVALARLPSRDGQEFNHIASSSRARFTAFCSDM